MHAIQSKLFSQPIPSSDDIFTPDLRSPLRQQSVQSLNKINKHYQDFQQALYMLKMSVEELWHIELDQLRDPSLTSQVPSIYTCRPVLPIASETKPWQNKIFSNVDLPIVLHPSSQEIISNKSGINDTMIKSTIQSLSDQQKSSTKSLLSINQKSKQYGSGDNFSKYRTKTALLHLKFRCLKHMP